MVCKGNLNWRQAALSALLMSSAVSANYQQTRGTHGEAARTVRSVEHSDRHVQERSWSDDLGVMIKAITGGADNTAEAGGAAKEGKHSGPQH